MKFCTAINCMDGRVQRPVIEYLQNRFSAECVDTITEPGPDRILAEQSDSNQVESIFTRLEISVARHQSSGVAVVGHYDCAGNPVPKDEQVPHIESAVKLVRERYPNVEVIGLWVDENWRVHEIC